MKLSLRGLFEKLGLVRSEESVAEHFGKVDKVIEEGKQAAREARLERLNLEATSFRREHQRQ